MGRPPKAIRRAQGLIWAAPAPSPFGKARGSNPAGRLGLQYERKVKKELEYHKKVGNIIDVVHNPYFKFSDTVGAGACCPDFVLYTKEAIVIVEVKLTWVAEALEKLTHLYIPVLEAATGLKAHGLVVCRNMVPGSPPALFTLAEALAKPGSLLYWPNIGRIIWQ